MRPEKQLHVSFFSLRIPKALVPGIAAGLMGLLFLACGVAGFSVLPDIQRAMTSPKVMPQPAAAKVDEASNEEKMRQQMHDIEVQAEAARARPMRR